MVVPPSGAGFGRQYRLLSAEQFQFVLRQKKSVHMRYFSVHVATSSADCPRLGITVSRRVSKKAVQRNRIKRQIRNSFRMNKAQRQLKDFVVIAKVGCADADNSLLHADLERLWTKADAR